MWTQARIKKELVPKFSRLFVICQGICRVWQGRRQWTQTACFGPLGRGPFASRGRRPLRLDRSGAPTPY